MKRVNLLISLLIALVLILLVLNILQWHRSQNVSARPAIVFAWSETDGIFDDDALFRAFKETVSSRKFIENILEKPRYRSIRERFLKDWNPEVTRTKVSDLYGNPRTLYWGRELRILSELIDEIYDALRLELDHYRSLARNSSAGTGSATDLR